MKKEYKAPEATKIEFDYEENVVASGLAKQTDGAKCTYTDPCTQQSKECLRSSQTACRWG